jgi:hypothetical protein
MVSTFGSLAASPLPRAMLLMAANVHTRRRGELTGPTSATPSDEAAKALLSCGNPATEIIAYRRYRGALQRMGGTTAGRAGSVRRPWRAEAFRSRSWVQGCRVCSDAGADPDAPFELDGITEGALVDIGFGRSHHVDEAPMETHTSHAEVLVEADRPVVGVRRDEPDL